MAQATRRKASPRRTTSAVSLGKKAPFPAKLLPQLATAVSAPPHGSGWVYEAKFDGYRVLARVAGDDVALFTRNGNDWTARMGPLRDELAALGLKSAWLDGEIVVLDPNGRPDFQRLQQAFDGAGSRDIVYFAFDLLYFDGHDLRREPLVERRRRLKQAFDTARPGEHVRYSETLVGPVDRLLADACKGGFEGIIGKRADSLYTSARSSAWIKLKCTQRQEFVVGGYTEPKGRRTGFGGLLLGVHDDEGRLVYAGKVGTGFDEALLRSIEARLKALEVDRSPFHDRPREVRGHWVRPVLVAEVSFSEWTGEGRVRHPVFRGLRADKDPATIVRERPRSVESTSALAARRAAPTIKVTHPERVIDPSSGATKLDLVRYYEAVAEHMLPHLQGRPVSMVRAPTGVAGEQFFQKHTENYRIPGVRQLDPSLRPGHAPMLEIASAESLVAAAQMNVVEFHTWNSTVADIDRPDRVIFDLDPGEGVSWESLRDATRLTKGILELLGLLSFLKTSGGKGVHVVVPLRPTWSYDQVKDFSRDVAEHLAATLPALFVAKSGARNRRGRIFVDYLRNGRTATTVAAFSARVRPGLGVNMPLAWSELDRLAAADQWNIFNVPARLRARRGDPWADYRNDQTLAAAAEQLARPGRKRRAS
ncbi:DNA ligase D [Nannocystis sp. ILAH1]|uniref:DNA ligase D n=1 Tax=Nannocystis sp. ILAH1 TaxID=2996789 RepID=UPI0022717F7C|nr:DNA ligase D [Nannocystis sp. ILAH1]MCY0992175.1 DNA ligase D [Nannocystis sp. ILAH1]